MKPALLARFLAAPLALFALTAAVHRAEGLQINFPDGWSTPEKDANGITTSTEPGDSGSNCNIENKKLASLDGKTQSDLNTEYGQVFAVADWADFLAVSEDSITIIAGEVRPVGELRQQLATLRVILDAETDVTLRYGFYVVPGRIVMTGCYARTDRFPAYATMYDAVIKSALPF